MPIGVALSLQAGSLCTSLGNRSRPSSPHPESDRDILITKQAHCHYAMGAKCGPLTLVGTQLPDSFSATRTLRVSYLGTPAWGCRTPPSFLTESNRYYDVTRVGS